ncbi:MAG: hypothetical protein KDA22_03290 [Phycisphaerales bacterium]|nr:hypothetical protein [Phycisphaerales bacterium]
MALSFRFLPAGAGFLGMGLGLLQGPLFGFVLGLHAPPSRHARIWLVLAVLHVVAAVSAALT